MVGRRATQPSLPLGRSSSLLAWVEARRSGNPEGDAAQNGCASWMGVCAVVRSTVGLLPLLDTVVVREYTARTGCARPASRLRSSLPKLALNAASLRQMIHADRTYNSPLPFSDVHIECTGAGLCTHEPPQMHPDRVPFTYHLLSVHRQPILVAGTQNPELSLRPFPS